MQTLCAKGLDTGSHRISPRAYQEERDRTVFSTADLAPETMLCCQATGLARVARPYRGQRTDCRTVTCGRLFLACEAQIADDALLAPCGHSIHEQGARRVDAEPCLRTLVPARWWQALETALRAQSTECLARVTTGHLLRTGRAHSPAGVYLVPLLAIGPRGKVAERVMGIIDRILQERGGRDV